MSQDKKISAMISQDAASNLQAAADEMNVSQSELIRQALEYYLQTLENRKAWLKLVPIK